MALALELPCKAVWEVVEHLGDGILLLQSHHHVNADAPAHCEVRAHAADHAQTFRSSKRILRFLAFLATGFLACVAGVNPLHLRSTACSMHHTMSEPVLAFKKIGC